MAELNGTVGPVDIDAGHLLATDANGHLVVKVPAIHNGQGIGRSGELLRAGTRVVLDINDPNGRWRIR